ncbi:MAG: HAD family hydrolase, partial [Terracidiphilus sp.]
MASSVASSPILLRCQGVLFDMDGILISSLGSVERSWTRWARLRGIDPAYVCGIAHGRRAIDTLAHLRPDLDSEAELKIVEDQEIADNDGLKVLPGVLELLAALPPDRWTVVTSATERLARARMAAGGIPVPRRLV